MTMITPAVAQWTEQRASNSTVAGSNPASRTHPLTDDLMENTSMTSLAAPVLTIVCPTHPDETGVIERATLASDQEGRKRMMFEKSAPRELLQGIPHGGQLSRVLDLTPGEPATYGAAGGVEPGKGRWRLILECPRASCNYRVERLLHPYRDHIQKILEAMEKSGETSWIFTDINREPWQWRRVTP